MFEYPNRTVDIHLYQCRYISGEFQLHDHSESRWVSKEELLQYDLAPADIPLAKYVLEDSHSLQISDLVVGNKYNNKQIATAFKCSSMGGMRRSKKTNSLVLIAKHNNPLYDDDRSWYFKLYRYGYSWRSNIRRKSKYYACDI